MHRLMRAFITKIPFLGRYRLLRASDIARLQEHNRLLTEAATERARKLQERETEFAGFATKSALKFQELQEHNRLLTEAATESARELQEREAEFSEFATESALKFQELQEHNRLLTEAATESARKLQEREAEFSEFATESARKLQEREAELTNAITVMSGRLTRLTDHNRWLTETMMDGAGNTEQALLSRAIIQRPQEMEGSIQKLAPTQDVLVIANETKPQVNGVRVQRPTPISVSIDHAAARHPNLQGRDHRSRDRSRQKRVLMIAPGLTRGGAERQILATADGLLRRGYEVEIFYFARVAGEPDFIDEFTQLGINCHHPFELGDFIVSGDSVEDIHDLHQFAQLVDHLDIIPLGRALAKTIREFRPEIVHCWSDLANVIGGLVATNLGVPRVVLGQRNVPAFRYVDGVAPYLCLDAYRLLAQNSNIVMLNNSLTGLTKYLQWLDVPYDKIKLVYNGFLPEGIHIRRGSETKLCRRRLGLMDDARVIGTVMRFAPEKDPHVWLETAAAIAAARPNTRFVLAGYGNLAEQIERRIETLGLAECFILPGAPKDVGLIYGALDVLLLTSRFEGTPNVLIEAQAAGIPVVAPDVGGTSEALLNGVTGILVGNRQASSLASAVLEILGDPGWRERAATQGPAFVSKKFGHQRMIDDTIAAYGYRDARHSQFELQKIGANR
jgi:glycosyltransferase involved in cell wall biosynthesis